MASINFANMTAPEALNTAIYNERLAAANYDYIADLCAKIDNYDAVGFFRDQANRERGHYNSLIKFREKAHYSGISPEVGEVMKWVSSELGADLDIRPDVSLDQAMKIVEEREKSAVEFYRVASSSCSDRELSELFGKLAEDESRHMYLADKLRATLEMRGKLDPPAYEDLGFQ